MWVSRKEWEALRKRVSELETRANRNPEPRIRIWRGPAVVYEWEHRSPSIDVSHETLLHMILDHLGLDLQKVDAVPATYKLAAKPKAAK